MSALMDGLNGLTVHEMFKNLLREQITGLDLREESVRHSTRRKENHGKFDMRDYCVRTRGDRRHERETVVEYSHKEKWYVWYDDSGRRWVRLEAFDGNEELVGCFAVDDPDEPPDWFLNQLSKLDHDEYYRWEIEMLSSTQDIGFGMNRMRVDEDKWLDEELGMDPLDIYDPAGDGYEALMQCMPGETEPTLWYERWDAADADPDKLTVGTTEPYIRALGIC